MKKIIIVELETEEYLNIEKQIPSEISMLYVEDNKVIDEINFKEDIIKKGRDLEYFFKKNNIDNEIKIVSDCGVFTKILLENWIKEAKCKVNFNLDDIQELEALIREKSNSEIENIYKEYENHNDSLEQCYDIFKMFCYA
ncbi:hypothetical protein [Clostridium perfringens]|uniref:hypothetical protein n=1 Tax=Clostridium perfringens TaxID=1502 RepID=UPI003F43F9E3